MLKVAEISKTFNQKTVNENRIFNKLSLNVNKGDFIAIIGSNGAGKSTLLNIISGMVPLDSGQIIIDGKDVSKSDEFVRSREIGRVFQNPSQGVAAKMTILENLSLADNKGKRYGFKFGINKRRIKYYKELLQEMNLGLEDKLDTNVELLSGGQRQALTLIMALMNKPKILLLDEHTAALDPKTSERIMAITRKIVFEKKVTTLMVTHNLKYALNSGNRLLMMHRGEIIVDVKGYDKKKLDSEKLMNLFEKVNLKNELSDRTLLG